MIIFRNVDKNNFQAAISLEVHENQKCFMEDNLFSIAECVVEKDFVTKVVYNDDEPIGFLLYYFVKDEPDYVFLHRYMIDKNHQGKGFGRATLEAAMDLFKTEFPSIGCVELMHYPDNKIGAAMYEAFGFVPTGERRESEPCRCEIGTENPDRYVEIVRRRYYTAL